MFTLKVSGKNVLMPLSEARRRLQIGTAAEIRMQNAAVREKDVVVREQAVTAGEQALAARVKTPQTDLPLPVLVQTGLSEETIRSRARDVMITAFAGTEDDAGDKLSRLLLDIRTPQQAVTPINRAEIVQEATSAAVSAVTVRDTKRDLVTGLENFMDKYPEIMADVNLHNMADGMTRGISAEHPEWSKSQVMLEAGKRTSEWVESLKGTPPPEPPKVPDVIVTAEDKTISEHTLPPPTQNREERKRTLVPMPQAAIATPPAAEPEERPQTPQEALDEVRRGRGQPTSE